MPSELRERELIAPGAAPESLRYPETGAGGHRGDRNVDGGTLMLVDVKLTIEIILVFQKKYAKLIYPSRSLPKLICRTKSIRALEYLIM
jgi:hypothetical protein